MKQSQALDILKTGANVFLTGAPGAGKTYVLNQYIEYLHEHDIPVAVTASTGIAATHIGGVTIHSWSGMGIKKQLSEWDIDNLQTKQYLWKRYEKTKVLIIDEISMLDAHGLNAVNELAKAFKRTEKPFGGMQMIVVGDFFQLPPVSRGEESVSFAFESQAWGEAKFLTCYLDEQYRQDDSNLLDILGRIRTGELEEDWSLLEDRYTSSIPEDHVTHLYTHNADVDALNQSELDALDTEEVFYTMSSKGSKTNVDRLKNSCLSPATLTLKIGALVMCTKNNFEAGYANGTLGTVVGFDEHDEYPIIQTRDGRESVISPAIWAMHDGDTVLASIEQIPLRLAWAITVHKSQGMSLDAAYMDLSNVFEYGQGYVALSRVRSLEGLYLAGFNQHALLVHPKVKVRDKQFQRHSATLRDYTETKDSESITESHHKFIIHTGGSLEKVEKKEKKNTSTTYEQTKKCILEGKDIQQTAKERELAIETITSHIEKLTENRSLSLEDIEHIRPKKKDLEIITSAFQEEFEKTGKVTLTPVKSILKDKYSFQELKIARLFFDKK
ncbi:AAA family ATPase [Candidatus Nomurabacteria bacterium]|nr:AAA family ATPase [Candidatus Nomurabacteria bacterium]